ncbi:MAG: crossover junction endodeoxyribonuclease RuvC [Verrucomicrobiae bacterium]|nr:crossover junction endodeoxyribonuclease RuvC [Verrucomicrobiae bacterium]
MVILGIDPSLRSTGFGIITGQGQKWSCPAYGVIKNPAALRLSACLARISEAIERVIIEFKPNVLATEGIFFLQNQKIAITLGHARGAAIAVAARTGMPIFEYAPRRIKQSVVGFGGAGKNQVAAMIRPVLGLKELPPPDAADALAIALTHANQILGIQTGKSAEI